MSDAERARVQQQLAEAIRRYLASGLTTADVIIEATSAGCRKTPYAIACLAGLAAAAADDRIWDALAQVRQVVKLERGNGEATR